MRLYPASSSVWILSKSCSTLFCIPIETPHSISARTPPRWRQSGRPTFFASRSQQAVSMAHITRIYLTTDVTLQVMYEDLPHVERLIAANEATIEEATYLASVTLRVGVRHSKLDHFLHAITETFRGRVEVTSHPASPTLP